MFKRNLWKLALTLGLMVWSIATILPYKKVPFEQYVKAHATVKPTEFASLLSEAEARKDSGKATSVFVALGQVAKEKQTDLTQFFPEVKLEASLKNIDTRNRILLNELLRRSMPRLQQGLDLAGGVSVTLEEADTPADKGKSISQKDKISKAIEIISNRINAFGVAEPIIRQVGDNRIDVELPSLNTKDNPDIVNQVKAPAKLDFRQVHPTLTPGPGVDTPPGYEIMTMDDESGRRSGTEELFVKRIPEMTGESISNAFARPDMYGKPEVILQFTKEGKRRFAEVTKEIADQGQQSGHLGRLAIVLDGKLHDAPTVKEEIDSDSAQISGGGMSERDAITLANILNNPLDVALQVKQEFEVGPTLAAGAIAAGKRATIVGIGLVAAFMISYYTVAGFVAVLSVTLNILIVLGVLASFGATLSMPGIAGIVLTVGMAVDAHILIFERMREELKLGKTLVAAFHAGHDKAFMTIVDANLTTLITSGLMIAFGNGPVKGFGVSITIGIFSTMFTALLVSQMLLDFLISSGVMKKMHMLNLLGSPRINFVKYGRRAFISSWLIVLIGVAGIAVKGHKIYGIDFLGGDVVSLTFKHRVDAEQLQSAADKANLGEITTAYQSEIGTGQELLNLQTESGKGTVAAAVLQKDFPEAGFEVVGRNEIGPAVGKEIQWNALMSIGLSIVGIMLYVAFRFEIGYGIGAVVSTVHDVLMTIGIFVLTGRQFSAPMVGAILLIVGYSINDTIVVFDRIREEMKINPTAGLRDVINIATSKVFARSILTSLTTFLAALALYLFGGGVIDDLAFTFLVGIVTGTFSSIFIASPIFYWWHKGDRKHVEAHHDIMPKYEWTGSSKASQ